MPHNSYSLGKEKMGMTKTPMKQTGSPRVRAGKGEHTDTKMAAKMNKIMGAHK